MEEQKEVSDLRVMIAKWEARLDAALGISRLATEAY